MEPFRADEALGEKFLSFIDTLKTDWPVLFEWIKAHGVLLGIASGASFVGSILCCTVVIAYLPYDYFLPKKRVSLIRQPVLRVGLMFLKNLLAGLLIIVGLIQLLLPGQGVLTILIGLVISDIPGKRQLERRIIRIPMVLSAANRIRSRFKRPPLVLEAKKE